MAHCEDKRNRNINATFSGTFKCSSNLAHRNIWIYGTDILNLWIYGWNICVYKLPPSNLKPKSTIMDFLSSELCQIGYLDWFLLHWDRLFWLILVAIKWIRKYIFEKELFKSVWNTFIFFSLYIPLQKNELCWQHNILPE